ncbi:MAG: DUF839 domain-containing protein [Thermoleophilaceae bacterium]|nr:DUF839 domain-containing protein [Thermoleophilaceae bacterium]
MYGGALAAAGPLQALTANAAAGRPVRTTGYGGLEYRGELRLPRGFQARVISRAGEAMSDGNPTPGVFDGMAAFPGAHGTTVLIRNHENRRLPGETPVVVPAEKRYDPDPSYNAGNTKLVVSANRRVVESYAVLGGTSTNCAGGRMPWGSWVTCEEVFDAGGRPHGYVFEIDARASGAVAPEPIKGAGRFVHEAVAWLHGALYLTEDRPANAALYRYVPDREPRLPGELARTAGVLQALRVKGRPNAPTASGWPVGTSAEIEWVRIDDPEPATDAPPTGVRFQAQAKGAAAFERQEGIWAANGLVFFDCTTGGAAGKGQVWVLDPLRRMLTLIYESPGSHELDSPDNLVVVPATNDLMLCEDGSGTQFLRGLTVEGEIYDFAETVGNNSEFCGACFDPKGLVLFVNQQGGRPDPPAVTYAIWGPWRRASA